MSQSGNYSAGHVSDTSTLTYEQEPFEKFQHKVNALCISIGLGTPSLITRMQGGSFNRVVGLCFTSPPRQYIIRIPRFELDDRETQGIKDQVAVLLYLRAFLPVAKVIAYDSTAENAIGAQYVIQERIAGSSIEAIYGSLTLEEKLQITEKVGDLIVKIEAVKIEKFGTLVAKFRMPELSNDVSKLTCSEIGIKGYKKNFITEIPSTTAKSIPEVLLAMFKVQTDYHADDKENSECFQRLHLMLIELASAGFLAHIQEQPRLAHWDLSAQNILVSELEGVWKVTGVIDWDDVMSVPAVIGRKPPIWLWDPEVHVADADILPQGKYNDDQQKIKAKLEEVLTVSLPGWPNDAYLWGRWLRRVWTFALYGFEDSQDLAKCQDLISEWEEYLVETRNSPAASKSEVEEVEKGDLALPSDTGTERNSRCCEFA